MNKNILIGAGVAVLLTIGAVLYILLSDDEERDIEAEEAAAEEEERDRVVVDVGNAFYVPIPRPLVFNLSSGDRDRTVQISVQLMVRGAKNERIALNNIPLAESALLNEFTASDYDELLTQAGKQELNVRSLRAVQSAFNRVAGKPVVEQVLFTGFVIQ